MAAPVPMRHTSTEPHITLQGFLGHPISRFVGFVLWVAVPLTCSSGAVGQSRGVTATTLTVTAGGSALSSIPAGTVVTLTAMVTSGATPVTPGQVNFCDAAAKYCTDIHVVGTAQLTSSGTATVKVRLGVGKHNLKAVFLATNTFAASSSGTSGLTVTGKDPSFTTIQESGSPGNYTLTATVGGQNGPAAPVGMVLFLDTSYGNATVATAELQAGAAGLNFLRSLEIATDNQSTSIAVGDLNGDGIPDLAVASYFDGVVTILLGNGDGTFTPAHNSPITGQFDPKSIIIGDFNGDGKQDLAFTVGSYSGGVAIYLGQGDGTFIEAPNSPITVGGAFEICEAVAVADLNGDGIPDLVVTNDAYVYGPSSVAILLGKGDGTFTPAPNSPVQVGSGPLSVAFGDLNGDGIPDLVTANFYDATATVLLGKGDGTFAQAASSPITVGQYPYAVAIGDLDQNGKADIAVVNENYTSGDPGSVSVLLGNGDGTFVQAQGSPITVGRSPQAVAIGDFNADGIPDLAVVNSDDDTVQALLGSGNGEFSPAPNGPVSVGNFPSSVALGDFSGAGVSDMAVADQGISTANIIMTAATESTATVNGIAPVGVETHLVDANYGGDSIYLASVSSTVTLNAGLAPLSISPASGSYSTVQTLTLSESIPGASIYYSAYGVMNTNGFVPYTGPITLAQGGNVTIQAYATETGYLSSNSVTATYNLNFPVTPAPTISPAAGYYAGPQTVTITDSDSSAKIYYTTNGPIPTSGSNLYSGPITVNASETLVAVALSYGGTLSLPISAQYVIGSSSVPLIYSIAGTGAPGYTGDGGPAVLAQIQGATGIVRDAAGNIYFSDAANHLVRKIAAGTGTISVVAGNGYYASSGDGGPATSAALQDPEILALDGSNLYISDPESEVVRKVDLSTGTISTYAGNGTCMLGGDGGPASAAGICGAYGLAVDASHNLYIAGGGNSIRRVNAATGIITTIAGGTYGYSGDGGPASSAGFRGIYGLAFDASGSLYIADAGNQLIRKIAAVGSVITPSSIISAVAGTPL